MEIVHLIEHANADYDGQTAYMFEVLYSGIKRRRGCGQRRRRVAVSLCKFMFANGRRRGARNV